MAAKTSDATLPANGEVAFELENGGRMVLKFGINAMVAVEEDLDRPITEVAALLAEGNPRISHVRILFRAALLCNDPGITLERAGDIMTELGPQRAADLVSTAFQAAFPAEGDPKARPTRAAK